jgi:hypothetical protein
MQGYEIIILNNQNKNQMVKYLSLRSRAKLDILVSIATTKGFRVCEEYIQEFDRYPIFTIDTSRGAEEGNHIWGQYAHDDAHLLSFEGMLDLLLDYKQEHEYHLSNRTKAVWKQGDDFVKINGDIVELSAIKNLITVINTLNQ